MEPSTASFVPLMPHLRAPDQPKTKIDVVYGEGKGNLDVVAQVLRSVGLLEAVAERAASAYAWPEPFTLEAKSCGFVNGRRFRRSLSRLRRNAGERPQAQVEVINRPLVASETRRSGR